MQKIKIKIIPNFKSQNCTLVFLKVGEESALYAFRHDKIES